MMTSESHMKSNFDYKKDRSPELFIIKLTNLFQEHKTLIIKTILMILYSLCIITLTINIFLFFL